jgi:fibronectin type 3 domain-containing protein
LLTTTSARTYRDKKVSGNVAYQYSVKALDKNNNESDFSALKENRYIQFPKLLSRASAVGGVQITWQKVAGATSYRIYRRGAASNNWSYLGEVPATQSSFFDKEGTASNQIKSGNYYRYTVRASYSGKDSFGKDHLRYSGFDTNGLYLKYMATPKLTSISNAGAGNTEGIKITWNKVNGGGTTWYRVYRRGANSSNWRYLGATQGNTWTDKETKNYSGNYYRYTVRAVAGTQDSGWYSAFDTNGLYIKRIANPTLKSATSAKAGITVKWSPVKGTTGYYVYRKTANSGWQCVGTVKGTNNVSFLDKTAKKGTTYTYTVRACYGTTKSNFNSGIKCYDKY